MKTNFKKILALLLAGLVCLPAFSCGENNGTPDVGTSGGETTPEETTSKWLDSLPDKDMNGTEINILTAAEQWSYFYDAEDDGDIVNDSVYARNKTVEERFNCKLNYRIYNGYMGGMSDVKSALTGSVMGGTKDFDLMVGGIVYIFPLIADNLYSDLSAFEQLDFSQPWWFNNMNEEFSINNGVYLGLGAYGMMNTAESLVVFFNKNVVEDYELEDLYQTVTDHKWTFDKMMELATVVTHDMNSDNVIDSSDLVGITSTPDYIPFLTISMGYNFAEHNDGRVIIKNIDEKLMKISEKMLSLYSGNEYFASNTEIDYATMRNTFASNHCLFMIHRLEHAGGAQLRDMGEFGIIPTPLFDEQQAEYITPAIPEAACIPLVVNDFDNSAMVLEALQSETYRSVLPIYFEKALKIKYASDEMTGKMLDIINSNKQSDITYGFLLYINDLYPMYKVGTKNISSFYAKNLDKLQGTIDSFQDELESHD